MPGACCVCYTAAGSLALDRDAPRLRTFQFGQAQFENALVIGRLHLLLIHYGRQHKGALEWAVGALQAMVVVLLHRCVALALAAQDQGVLVYFDTHLVFGNPGQVGREDQGIIRLIDVDGRGPGVRPSTGLTAIAAPEELMEQVVHLVLEGLELPHWRPPCYCHGCVPLL